MPGPTPPDDAPHAPRARARLLARLPGAPAPWLALLLLWLAARVAAPLLTGADLFALLEGQLGGAPWLEGALLGLGALLVCGGGLTLRRAEPPAPPRRRTTTLLLGGLILVAAALRLYALDRLPATFDWDSAQNGFVAQELWADLGQGEYRAVLHRWAPGNETLFFYLQGAFLSLFGVSIAGLRLPSALLGIVTVYAVYRAGRALFGARVALFAGALCALSPVHLVFSRAPKRAMLVPLLVALTLLALTRLLRAHDPPRLRRSWLRHAALAGLVLGLGLHTYELFRLVPPAVGLALLWVRWRRGELRRGLAELSVMALCAAVVAAPLIVAALRSPEAFFHHAALALGEGVGGEHPLAPLRNLAGAWQVYLGNVLSAPQGEPALGAATTLIPPLILCGLVLLLCSPRAAPGDACAEARLNSAARPLLVALLLGFCLLYLITSLDRAPRRYMGLLVPSYLLAALALDRLGAALDALRPGLHLGPLRPGRLVQALALGGLALAPLSTFAGLARPIEGFSQTRAAAVLAYGMKQTGQREVYLSPALQDNHFLLDFYLRSGVLRQLQTGLPLPHGPLARPLLLVSLDEAWEEPLSRLYGAKPRAVTLPLPRLPAWAKNLQRPSLKLKVYELDPARVRRHRVAPGDLAGAGEVGLLVPRSGLYSFRVGPEQRAAMTLDGVEHALDHSDRTVVGLAAGLHRLRVAGGDEAPTLQWLCPDEEQWKPVAAGQLWRFAAETWPEPPPVREAPFALPDPPLEPVELPATAEDDRDLVQDLCLLDGRFTVVSTELNRLYRLRAGGAQDPPVTLSRPNGEPFRDAVYTEPHIFADYQLQLISFRLAAGPDGYYLLDRHRGRVSRFNGAGEFLGHRRQGLSRPLDLAAAGQTLYIADPARGAVLALAEGGRGPATVVLDDVSPVSLDVAGETLALLDARRHRALVCELPGCRRQKEIFIGRVTETMTLSLAADRTLSLTEHARNQVLLISPRGELWARRGDTGFVARGLPLFAPVAAALDSERGAFVLVGENQAWQQVLGER